MRLNKVIKVICTQFFLNLILETNIDMFIYIFLYFGGRGGVEGRFFIPKAVYCCFIFQYLGKGTLFLIAVQLLKILLAKLW